MTSSKEDDHTETMKMAARLSNDHDGQQSISAEARQIKTNRRKSRQQVNGYALKSIIWRFLFSSRKTFVLNLAICNIIFFMLSTHGTVKCDDDLMRYQSPNFYEINQSKQQEESAGVSIENNQQNSRQNHLGDAFSQQEMNFNLNQGAYRGSNPNELSLVSNMLNQLNNQHDQAQQHTQEQRHNQDSLWNSGDSDLLETAQSKYLASQSKSVATSANESSEKSSGGATDTSASSSSTSSTSSSSPASSSSSSASSSSPSSSSPSPLSEQLSIVSNLIQQAGQLGLTAAQQNVALSEAILNGVTNTLIRNTQNSNRKQAASNTNAQHQQAELQLSSSPSSRPNNIVGQGIDGSITIDTDQLPSFGNIINNLPNLVPNLNFSGGAKPAINSAIKPFLVTALKTVPIKLGAVGWKLLQLLAWKKIYKTHHPKSGEIIIEQEMKPSGHGIAMMDKGGKMSGKMGDHLAGLGNKLKTAKMGQSYMSDDWMSMMRSTGQGDMFSGGWPQASSDSPTASASMIYQRHLMPPSLAQSSGTGGGSQQAAAAAAAAAATAAAIQSHWIQQQNMMADEATGTSDNQQARSNQTSSSSGGTGAASSSGSNNANALRRKKASFGGGNWFAATPAQAYAAAAAAANAAATMASQQQQHQQRIAHMMRAYEFGGNPDPMQIGFGGGGMRQALANNFMYHNLFDNAAAMAVQNAVKLPPTDGHNHHHLSNVDFLDQSDSLSGSSFGSFSSNDATYNSLGDSGESIPMTLMQRHDTAMNQASQPNVQLAPLNGYPAQGDHKSSALFDGMADFDETPAGKLLVNAMNESSNYPVYHLLRHRDSLNK